MRCINFINNYTFAVTFQFSALFLFGLLFMVKRHQTFSRVFLCVQFSHCSALLTVVVRHPELMYTIAAPLVVPVSPSQPGLRLEHA